MNKRGWLSRKNRGTFQMKYVGEVESSGAKTSFLGIKEEEPLVMIRKSLPTGY